jgi:hypothetical protein
MVYSYSYHGMGRWKDKGSKSTGEDLLFVVQCEMMVKVSRKEGCEVRKSLVLGWFRFLGEIK